jgi:hypothetical protein
MPTHAAGGIALTRVATPLRRIVTGLDALGHSAVIIDGSAAK